ncbi:hypothetical protein BJ322DRAFT_1024418 [Thelephora terrestris]|uniref:Uncharacterized protein n=1 Tax=Thelephora terrestris TaxID=56493 RepID=A0A9P6L2K2_9AGAM|nr:hypothetical protein BJ322DRAFT_1024418 [Thelephora terrestris]
MALPNFGEPPRFSRGFGAAFYVVPFSRPTLWNISEHKDFLKSRGFRTIPSHRTIPSARRMGWPSGESEKAQRSFGHLSGNQVGFTELWLLEGNGLFPSAWPTVSTSSESEHTKDGPASPDPKCGSWTLWELALLQGGKWTAICLRRLSKTRAHGFLGHWRRHWKGRRGPCSQQSRARPFSTEVSKPLVAGASGKSRVSSTKLEAPRITEATDEALPISTRYSSKSTGKLVQSRFQQLSSSPDFVRKHRI